MFTTEKLFSYTVRYSLITRPQELQPKLMYLLAMFEA